MAGKSKSGKPGSGRGRGKASERKTVSEEVFIKLDEPNHVRRLLLLSAKNSIMIRILSQQINKVRVSKAKKVEELRESMDDLEKDIEYLKGCLPTDNLSDLGIDLENRDEEEFDGPVDENILMERKLEKELDLIEKRLGSL